MRAEAGSVLLWNKDEVEAESQLWVLNLADQRLPRCTWFRAEVLWNSLVIRMSFF